MNQCFLESPKLDITILRKYQFHLLYKRVSTCLQKGFIGENIIKKMSYQDYLNIWVLTIKPWTDKQRYSCKAEPGMLLPCVPANSMIALSCQVTS